MNRQMHSCASTRRNWCFPSLPAPPTIRPAPRNCLPCQDWPSDCRHIGALAIPTGAHVGSVQPFCGRSHRCGHPRSAVSACAHAVSLLLVLLTLATSDAPLCSRFPRVGVLRSTRRGHRPRGPDTDGKLCCMPPHVGALGRA